MQTIVDNWYRLDVNIFNVYDLYCHNSKMKFKVLGHGRGAKEIKGHWNS